MLKIEKNEGLDKQSEWHAIPATLTSSEPVQNGKVKNYFGTSIREQPSLTAVLQGHSLFGRRYKEPNLYKCVSYRSNQRQNSVQIVLNERVGNIIDWRKDTPWQKFQGHMGSLQKFVIIQRALHE